MPKPKTIGKPRSSSIWKRFASQASVEQRTALKNLVSAAAGRLIQVRDTFPTYTLHNQDHAENIIETASELLGKDVGKLTALEAAMIILSAYFHDTGMAFTAEERAQISGDEHFPEFLRKHPRAAVAMQKKSGQDVSDEIAEWFCRWRHAERVWVLINQIRNENPEWLGWETYEIGDPLGHLCASHNLEAVALKDDDLYPADYRAGDCDLRFCSILLRLADILDFDRTRTPEQLYRDLGLSERQDKPGQTSDLEWRKHLVSEGFKFPPDRGPSYDLPYLAGPKDPAVEYDIRRFLDVIDAELGKCGAILRTCSDKWRDLPLPARIDRRGIKGTNYDYGEHRFTLDQREVLELLMGDRLYDNPLVFIRELLQNALDTSRHREFHERESGNLGFVCQPIRASEWTDSNGYRWVRIEDFGMGMTEAIIHEFLLQVGKSYYNSAQFEADVLRYQSKTRETFKPISRFGIGLLSCFIIGDQVEISTRHVSSPDGPLRLSLPGLQSFFVFQKRPHAFRPMPSPVGQESGERKSPGTTICVRFSPRKEIANFALKTELQRHLLCPPIPVEFEGERIGGDPEALLHRPWCEPKIITLSDAQTREIGKVVRHQFSRPLQVRVLPVDLTRQDITPNLKGQMFIAYLEETDEVEQAFPKGISGIQMDAFLTISASKDVEYHLIVSREPVTDTKKERDRARIDLNLEISSQYWLLNQLDRYDREGEETKEIRNLAASSHNGITFPLGKYNDIPNPMPGNRGQAGFVIISLWDRFRPELSIARDKLLLIPSFINSAFSLAVRRSLSAVLSPGQIGLPELFYPRVYSETDTGAAPGLGELMEDELLNDPGMWASEAVFSNAKNRELCSARDLFERKVERARLSFLDWSSMQFSDMLRAAIARRWLRHSFVVFDQFGGVFLLEQGPPKPIMPGEKLFPPLFFAEYQGDHKGRLQTGDSAPLRLDHPFSVWVLSVATQLDQELPGLLYQIKRALLANQWSYAHSMSNETRCNQINQALKRIGELRHDLKPPKNAFLEAKRDFPKDG